MCQRVLPCSCSTSCEKPLKKCIFIFNIESTHAVLTLFRMGGKFLKIMSNFGRVILAEICHVIKTGKYVNLHCLQQEVVCQSLTSVYNRMVSFGTKIRLIPNVSYACTLLKVSKDWM